MTTIPGVFDAAFSTHWPYRFDLGLYVENLRGGVPNQPDVIRAWLRAKLDLDDTAIEKMVAETMAARNIADRDEAIDVVAAETSSNGFKRDGTALVLEGRQLKAAIKEAFSVAGAAGKIPMQRAWGVTKKGLLPFIAEHVMVVEQTIILRDASGNPITEPDGIEQTQVSTFRGTSFKREEFVTEAWLRATIVSDWDFKDQVWETMWVTGQLQGLGASRSQGRGRYTVTEWNPCGQDA